MPRRYKPMRNVTKKKVFVPYKEPASTVFRQKDKEYPSLVTDAGKAALLADRSVQIAVSSSYTIAPAYNKGAYTVIPKDDIVHIGK